MEMCHDRKSGVPYMVSNCCKACWAKIQEASRRSLTEEYVRDGVRYNGLLDYWHQCRLAEGEPLRPARKRSEWMEVTGDEAHVKPDGSRETSKLGYETITYKTVSGESVTVERKRKRR